MRVRVRDENRVREYAEAGRKVLNERGPEDWPFRIVEPVDVYSPWKCPLGQIYRDEGLFAGGLAALRLHGGATVHGFTEIGFRDSAATRELNTEWERIVAEERAARGGKGDGEVVVYKG